MDKKKLLPNRLISSMIEICSSLSVAYEFWEMKLKTEEECKN
jgi:hypothetical protein